MAFIKEQAEVFNSIERGHTNSRISFLKGDPGSGKTYILKYLLEEKKDYLYFSGNFRKQVLELKSTVDNFSGSILKAGPLEYLSIIKYLIPLIKRNRQRIRLKSKMDNDYYSALLQLNNMSRSSFRKSTRKRVIVADEANFWDEEDITLLSLLFDNDVLIAFPRLEKISIILAYSSQYYRSLVLNQFLRMKNETNTFLIKSFSKNQMNRVIQEMGIDHELNKEEVSNLYRISLGSNLALLLGTIDYIKSNTSSDLEELSSIILKYLKRESEIENVLRISTVRKEKLFLEELIELAQRIFDFDKVSTKEYILKAVDKRFLKAENVNLQEVESGTVKFLHQDYYKYFYPKNNYQIKKYFLAYGEVLKSLTPGDYKERAKCLKAAGQEELADIYKSISLIQQFIFGKFPKISIINSSEVRNFVLEVKKVYEELWFRNSSESLNRLDRIKKGLLPELLKFEYDYAFCKCALISADIHTIQNIQQRMKEWASIDTLKNENEIKTRIYFILYLTYVYEGNQIGIDDCESQILNLSKKLSRNNNRYDFYQYSLKRRALMSHFPQTAYENTLDSLKFFEKRKDDSILYFKEYFFSLINHSDNCRLLALYDTAFDNIDKALKIYIENEHKNLLPNITLFNNYAITGFLAKKLSVEKATHYLFPILEGVDFHISTDSTYVFICNNIACLHAYDGDYKTAEDYFNKASVVMSNTKSSIKNQNYMLKFNKAILLYLLGRKKECLSIVKAIKGTYTYKHSKIHFMKRENIFSEIFQSEKQLDLEGIRKLLNVSSNQKSPWNAYSDCFLFWGIQYWSK